MYGEGIVGIIARVLPENALHDSVIPRFDVFDQRTANILDLPTHAGRGEAFVSSIRRFYLCNLQNERGSGKNKVRRKKKVRMNLDGLSL